MIGLVLALFGVGLTAITGDALWDGLGTLCIGALLILISVTLTIEMKSLLIGEAATEEHVVALTNAASGAPLVRRVIDLRTQHLGPEELLVAAKIEFDGSLNGEALTHAIDGVEWEIRAAVTLAMRIYIEPDVYDPDWVDNG